METTIQLKHPAGKKAVSMDKGKYDSLKKVLLNCLKTKGESNRLCINDKLKKTNQHFK